jgi:hypothetical protein
MLCSNAEYKNMDQGESLGQLHDVHNCIKIYYKQSEAIFLVVCDPSMNEL